MTPERFRRLEALYDAVAGMNPDARDRYIEEDCAGDDEMRRELLAAFDDDSHSFLTNAVEQAARSMAQQADGPKAKDLDSMVRPTGLQSPTVNLESLPGSTLDQKYRIEKQLGKGAMGTVFQATHIGTTRPVAIKVVAPRLARNPEFVQRFKREAEVAGRLNHPNVVNVTDFGVARVDGSDLAYLVMEYLDGQTLADYLKDNPRPPFDFLLDTLDQICLALDAAHASGIVHRDLKPSNVWLQPNHRGGFNVKVLDFGIAKLASPDVREATASDFETMLKTISGLDATVPAVAGEVQNLLSTPSHLKTIAGTLLGTPAYMAPEQCGGFGVDARTDIYSVAVIAYEMLCGRVPFESENLAQLLQLQIQTAPPSPQVYDATVPQTLALVVLNGLEKDPARRPSTAGTFAQRLRAASEGELSLIRKSKDLFHSHLSAFMPIFFTCFASAFVGIIAARIGVAWLVRSLGAGIGPFFVLFECCVFLMMVFWLQLFKAACTLMIVGQASANGQFEATRGPVLRALGAGLGSILRTQLLSMIDLRPSSFRANILWPVVWAAEGRSGWNAIERSRQLCAAAPWIALALTVRQYGPAMLASLMSGVLVTLPGDPDVRRDFAAAIQSGSKFGTLLLFYSFMFGMAYLNFGAAFSFLYLLALRCRSESFEITLPNAEREASRKWAAKTVRPATIAWGLAPVMLLILIIVRLNR